MISGIWLKVKRRVIGMMPQTLNATQVSVEKLRQTISLSTARNRKNRPQRNVSLRQPSASSWKARIEDVAEQRLAEEQAAEQHHAEQRVDDGRLHLDEDVVLQPERQPAEDEDDDAGDQRHDRQRAGQQPGHGERDRGRDHEQAGGDEDRPAERGQRREFLDQPLAARIGEEEDHQRPELQRELQQRVDLFLARIGGSRSRIGLLMASCSGCQLPRSPWRNRLRKRARGRRPARRRR